METMTFLEYYEELLEKATTKREIEVIKNVINFLKKEKEKEEQ